MSYLQYQLEVNDFEISSHHPPKHTFADGKLRRWPDDYDSAVFRKMPPLRFAIYDSNHCQLSRNGLERLIRPLVGMRSRDSRRGESPARLFFARRPVDIILGEVPGCGWALRSVKVINIGGSYLSFTFKSNPPKPKPFSWQDLPTWRAATYGGSGVTSIDFHAGPLHFLIETDGGDGRPPESFQIDLEAPLSNGWTPVTIIHEDEFRQRIYRFHLYGEDEQVAQPEKILMDVEEYF